MIDIIIFETGKKPRKITSHHSSHLLRFSRENGDNVDLTVFEHVDAREDDIIGYQVAYEGSKPSVDEINTAIDTLKPKGDPFQKP